MQRPQAKMGATCGQYIIIIIIIKTNINTIIIYFAIPLTFN